MSLAWRPPTPLKLLQWPLPHASRGTRWLARAVALLARRKVITAYGLEHVRPGSDPFILVLNHSTRLEAVVVPAVLLLCRGGRLIHFMADWNFHLIPGMGLLYRRSGAITVTRKSARPRCLNVFKPLYRHAHAPFEQARAHLAAGRSVGIFPEGTVNRDPARLLRGRSGAARLSLEAGVPIVPVGIRFPGVERGCPIPSHAAMELHIGAPLRPARTQPRPAPVATVRAWHAVIMSEVARLSAKSWDDKTSHDHSWDNHGAGHDRG